MFCLHGGIGSVSRSVNIPTAGLPLPHRKRGRVYQGRVPSFRSTHSIPSTFQAPASVTVSAVTTIALWRGINLHVVVASCTRSLLAFPSIPPSSVVSSRSPVVILSITIPVASSVPVTSVVEIPVLSRSPRSRFLLSRVWTGGVGPRSTGHDL